MAGRVLMTDISSVPQFLRRSEVTDFFPFITRNLLNYWAHQGIGPAYAFVGREAVYETAEIIRYLQSAMKPPGTGRPMPHAKKRGEEEGRRRRGAPTRAESRKKKQEAENTPDHHGGR